MDVHKITRGDVRTIRAIASLLSRKRGVPPTRRELVVEIGRDQQSLHKRLKRLRALRAIDGYEPNAARALSLRWLPCVRTSDGSTGLIMPIDQATVRMPKFKKRRSEA